MFMFKNYNLIWFILLFPTLQSLKLPKRRFNNNFAEEVDKTVRVLSKKLDLREPIKETKPYNNILLSELIESIQTYTVDHESRDELYDNPYFARKWLGKINFVLAKVLERNEFLSYNFVTNVTTDNQNLIEEFAPISNKLNTIMIQTAKKLYSNSNILNPVVRRQLILASKGLFSSNEEDVRTLTSISNQLETIYAKAKVCEPNNPNKCLTLEPDLENIISYSRDYNELLWAWKGWADVTGSKMKYLYKASIELQNNMAVENGYRDLSEYWIQNFEDDNFEIVMDKLLEQIMPIYTQLHAHVRRKLRVFYGNEKVPSKKIPAHLLGNMWSQNWENIYDIVVPYPNIKLPNLDEHFKNRNYTIRKLFEKAEEFFTSIGLYPMTKTFWKHSMMEKPDDREVQCHASAVDFSNGYDYRIKMCAELTANYFYVVHHEMGHIEYFMSYSDQPALFRSGANSAFHEAIGDTISLSVSSPSHLKKIGISENSETTNEMNINFLMKEALKTIAFLPFGYLIDKWRWDVFRKKITEQNYNQKWWQMREYYQGVESPIDRTEEDFDPGSKYHVAANVPYARYFISHFLKFQFYKALCKISGHSGDLHLCDFYGSKKAGHALKAMLSLGASKHWKYTLQLLTDEQEVNSDALFQYFKPLIKWLKKENESYPDDSPGWTD